LKRLYAQTEPSKSLRKARNFASWKLAMSTMVVEGIEGGRDQSRHKQCADGTTLIIVLLIITYT